MSAAGESAEGGDVLSKAACVGRERDEKSLIPILASPQQPRRSTILYALTFTFSFISYCLEWKEILVYLFYFISFFSFFIYLFFLFINFVIRSVFCVVLVIFYLS